MRCAEEAKEFFLHMEKLRAQATERLSTDQAKSFANLNKRRRDMPALEKGIAVCYKPERQTGVDKLEPPWKGPYKLVVRVGDHSYVLELPGGNSGNA